ncbi:hypothetical protein D3C71_2026130 [compost metagenome]
MEMRLPVTWMRSRVVASASAGAAAGAEASWAEASPVPAKLVAPTHNANTIASRSWVVFRVISLSKCPERTGMPSEWGLPNGV